MTGSKLRSLSGILYLIPIFISNIDLGPAGEVFLKLQFVCYPIMIALYFLGRPNNESKWLLLFLTFICVFYWMIIRFSYSGLSLDSLQKSIIFSLYVSASYVLYYLFKSNVTEFINILTKFVSVTVVLIYVSFFVWKLTGIYFLADDGYGFFRPHGLMTEPSAVTAFLSFLLVWSLLSKQYFYGAFVVGAVVLSGSVLALLISFISLIYFMITSRSVLFKLMFLVLGMLAIHYLYFFVLEYVPTGTSFADSQILRLKHAIISIMYLGEEGYNPRLNTLMDSIDYMSNNQVSYIFGNGPGSDSFIEFSDIARSSPMLPVYMLFNFGATGLMLYSYYVIKYGFLRFEFNKLNVLFVCLIFTTLINSAQGLLIYQLVLLMILFNREKVE